MLGGASGCKGIVIYDTDLTEKNSVFGYYEGDKIVVEVGEMSELLKLKDEKDHEFDRKDKTPEKIVVFLLLAVVVLSIAAFIKLSFFKAIFVTAILVFSYNPILRAWFTHINLYDSKEHWKQFKRQHGCEHKIINVFMKGKGTGLEDLKAASIFHTECGSMYTTYNLIFLVLLAIVGLNIASIGIIRGLLILLGMGILMLVNIIKQLHIFDFFQRNVVAEPTEREYALALEMMKEFQELYQKA